MTKKKINIALIILVLILWGIVIYRSINRYFPNTDNTQSDFISTDYTSKIKTIKKDTFKLIPISRDPFLGKITNPISIEDTKKIIPKKRNILINHNSQGAKTKIVKPIIEWPKISYYGYIKSTQRAEELILIKIESKLFKTRKNEVLDGILIKRIYKDSIEVAFNKEKKFIYINQ